MADEAAVHIGENSPQQVAYRLFQHVVHAEKKTLGHANIPSTVDRKYILDTYAECLLTVIAPTTRD